MNVSRSGAAYRGFGFVARSFEDLPTPERMAVCAAWLRGAASIGIDAADLMLVKVERRLALGRGPGGAEARRPRVATVRW